MPSGAHLVSPSSGVAGSGEAVRVFSGTAVCCWRRLRSKCHKCPNTAWALFLLFSFGLVALVSLSVYLSKKRLNLAVLGIGIVRTLCPCGRPSHPLVFFSHLHIYLIHAREHVS